MTKLLLLWDVLILMAVEVNSLDIRIDPSMWEGKRSYIYCDVGTVTTGVTFYTEPANVKGTCFSPAAACSSNIDAYTVSQNSTGVLLTIASVDASREKGEWYCQHSTDRSNTISVNDKRIPGVLLRADWTEPSGPVNTFSAVMTLSCTNQVPNFTFTYEDSKSKNGTVPPEAVSVTTNSTYDETTCVNGNKFYTIILKASNTLDVFNKKKGVTFTFNYYENSIDAAFSVDFLESGEGVSDGLEVWVIAVIGVVVAVLVIVVVSVIIIWSWKNKKWCFKEKEDKPTTKKKEKPSSDKTELGELRSAKRGRPPSPKVGHVDDKITSSVSSVNPEIIQQ